MATATEPREGTPLGQPGIPVVRRRSSFQLDLPGVLPIALVAATWEFLLVRVLTLAAHAGGEGEVEPWLASLAKVGTFAQNLTALLALVLLSDAVLSLVRDPAFGPITHRVTVAGFAAISVVVCGASVALPLPTEAALMGHAAAVLLSLLLVLGLLWHRVEGRLLVGAVLLLLPTMLRFYAACGIAVPLLRTEAPLALWAYHGAELLAVVTALASPFVFAGWGLRDFGKRSNFVVMGLASLPAVALAAGIAGSVDQVRRLTRTGVGFELLVPPQQVVYAVALYCFLLAVGALLLPGLGAPRPRSEQRIGYGLALLFLAGLDGLEGAVLALGAGVSDIPDLVQYLLEGNWSHMTREQEALVGPPLRDLYRVALLALGYVLIARGIHGRARALALRRAQQGADLP